jgi:hypothetical protein
VFDLAPTPRLVIPTDADMGRGQCLG